MQSQLTTQLHEIVWLMDRHADRWLKATHGISFAQFHVLIILHTVAPISQKGLAECLFYSDAAVSRMVKVLPDYITVTATLGRTRMLSLTPKGMKLAQSSAKHLEKMFCEIVKKSGVNISTYHGTTTRIRKILFELARN